MIAGRKSPDDIRGDRFVGTHGCASRITEIKFSMCDARPRVPNNQHRIFDADKHRPFRITKLQSFNGGVPVRSGNRNNDIHRERTAGVRHSRTTTFRDARRASLHSESINLGFGKSPKSNRKYWFALLSNSQKPDPYLQYSSAFQFLTLFRIYI